MSYDRHTGRPRGFGFVVFDDPAVADKVVSLQHTIDRREVRKPYHTTQQWRQMSASFEREPDAPKAPRVSSKPHEFV